MPSHTLTTSFMALLKVFNPWACEEWREATDEHGPLWMYTPEDDVPLRDRTHGYKAAQINLVKAYFKAFCELTTGEIKFGTTSANDDHKEARALLKKWLTDKWKVWNVGQVLKQCITEYELNQLSDWLSMDGTTVPDFNEGLPWTPRAPVIALRVFGRGVLVGNNSQFVQPAVKEYLGRLFKIEWERIVASYRKADKRVRAADEKLEERWRDFAEHIDDVDVKTVKAFIRDLNRHIVDLIAVGNTATREAYDRRVERLKDVSWALKKDAEAMKRIPKPLRLAIAQMTKDQSTIDDEIAAALAVTVQDIEDAAANDAPQGYELDDKWEEGTEEFANMNVSQLYAALGLVEGHGIPGMPEVYDTEGVHNVVDHADWFNNPPPDASIRPIKLRWHQLVGILKMLRNSFEGKPILLMDSVGIGKTLQVIGVIAMLAVYRDAYDENGDFPGEFTGKKWQGKEGNIPDLPNLIVVPNNLEDQMMGELRRFLRKGAFDIFPYTQSAGTRGRTFYDAYHDPELKQAEGRRIILARLSAIASDHVEVECPPNNPVLGLSKTNASTADRQFSILDWDFTFTAIDEIHLARNKGAKFKSLSYLSMKTFQTLLLITRQDVWNVAYMLRITWVKDPKNIRLRGQAEREISKAETKDRRKQEYSTILARSAVAGGEAAAFSEGLAVNVKWTQVLRKEFTGLVIRRTQASRDIDGNYIIDLRPYTEKIFLMTLYDAEYASIEAGAKRDGYSRSFYFNLRQALVHSQFALDGAKIPMTLDEWEALPSRKLDAVLALCEHHLQADNQPFMDYDTEDDGYIFSENANPRPAVDLMGVPLGPDKIVLYSAFPVNNAFIGQVLFLHGIKYVVVNGSISLDGRKKAIKAFNDADRDGPRVMILSSVGIMGLNLASACVIIVLDMLWSALEDEQLIGRVQRFPQVKDVVVYRLVGDKSPDVFLNNMSFNKLSVAKAFAEATPAVQAMYSGMIEDLPENLQAFAPEDGDAEPEPAKGKAKAKAKGGSKRGKGKGKSAATVESEEDAPSTQGGAMASGSGSHAEPMDMSPNRLATPVPDGGPDAHMSSPPQPAPHPVTPTAESSDLSDLSPDEAGSSRKRQRDPSDTSPKSPSKASRAKKRQAKRAAQKMTKGQQRRRDGDDDDDFQDFIPIANRRMPRKASMQKSTR
ncbi:hypothetical protein EUX98_g8376 [Antrodiella citrinella]|uniref:Helicase C-terminal domain-containing protein n=1 Tax=Antrodiella citrinella TaxID=2447956 RepID=A0A4V3XGH4_9APHY|nr:hypothetical protein EUX98_g8376 [Antrodiella citrinella]